MPQRVLALEITDADVKAAVLETTFRDYRVTGFYQQPFSAADGSREDQIRRFFEHHRLAADTVLSALPGDCVTWRSFFLPFRDRKRLAQTVPFELEGQVPFGLDEVVVDYQIIHRDRSGTTVLAALVLRKDLERHLETLQAAGIDPKVVDIAPLAELNILNLVSDLPPTFAFIDLGLQYVTVALYRNAALAGLRTIARGLRTSLTGSNGAEPQAPPADTIAPGAGAAVEKPTNGGDRFLQTPQIANAASPVAEVRWTLLALNGAPLDDQLPCYVAGEPAEVDRLERELAEALRVQVRRLDRVRLRSLDAETGGQASVFASSLGLALREVAPANALGLNFRRGEFTYHRSEQELRRGLRVVAALAALVVALTVADLYMGYRQLVLRVVGLDAQIRKVVAATLPDEPITQPRAQLQEEIDAVQQRLDLLHSVVPSTNSTSVDILRAVSGAIPNKIRVDSDEWSLEPDAIRVRGNTDTFESVDAIKQQLLATGLFSDVEVKDVKTAKDGAGVDFRLRLVFSKDLHPRGGQS